MKIRILAVGSRMPGWVSEGCRDYQRRLPPEWRLELIEIPLGKRAVSQPASRAIEQESAALLKQIAASDFVIALDVRGKSLCTEALAEHLLRWQNEGRDIALLIGGPDGLSQDCLQRANLRLSLSELTLPHPLVRILLLEQFYRAWTINVNHPYHRA